MHGEMEGGVVVFHGAQERADVYLCVELFHDLPFQSLSAVFPRLHLAAGELPHVLEFTVSPLCSENPVAVLYYGGYYLDMLHNVIYENT